MHCPSKGPDGGAGASADTAITSGSREQARSGSSNVAKAGSNRVKRKAYERRPAARASGASAKDPLLRFLNEWMADESGYDEKVWPALRNELKSLRSS
jgi:hypothetical protein